MTSHPPQPAPTSDRWRAVYDGACRFCIHSAHRLAAFAPHGAIELVDFHQPGALDHLPGLTAEACERELQLVSPAGAIFSGAEAVARAILLRPMLGCWAWLYYIPGLRQALDRLYLFIAKRRFRIMGRVDPCSTGACVMPGAKPPSPTG